MFAAIALSTIAAVVAALAIALWSDAHAISRDHMGDAAS
jgi:hypothetical protein